MTTWTEQAIIEDASRYSSYTDWHANSLSHNAAYRRKMIAKVVTLMNWEVRKQWTYKTILEDARTHSCFQDWKGTPSHKASLRSRGVFKKVMKTMNWGGRCVSFEQEQIDSFLVYRKEEII